MYNQEFSFIYVEKYRPKKLDDLVLDDDIKKKISFYLQSFNNLPNLLLYSKSPGTGKTSISSLIVNTLDVDSLYLNASSQNSIENIRNDVYNFSMLKTFREGKVVIFDEADRLSSNAQDALKVLIEEFLNVRYIFITNNINKIIDPLQSRTQKFEIRPLNYEQIKERCVYILKNENIKYTDEVLDKMIKRYSPDLRSLIQEIQKSVINNVLTVNKTQLLENEYKRVISTLLKRADEDSIDKIRKLIYSLQNIDFTMLFQYLFNNVDDFVKSKRNISSIMIVIAEYLYRDSIIIDKSINFIACCLEIMNINK